MRLTAIALASLAVAAPLLASCGGQARPAAVPRSTDASPGSGLLRITRVWAGRAVPIEGALSYIRVDGAGGTSRITRQLPAKPGTGLVIKLGSGVHRLASWQRICDGNCGNLDSPSNRCERAFSVGQGELLQVVIRVNFVSVETPCVIVLRR